MTDERARKAAEEICDQYAHRHYELAIAQIISRHYRAEQTPALPPRSVECEHGIDPIHVCPECDAGAQTTESTPRREKGDYHTKHCKLDADHDGPCFPGKVTTESTPPTQKMIGTEALGNGNDHFGVHDENTFCRVRGCRPACDCTCHENTRKIEPCFYCANQHSFEGAVGAVAESASQAELMDACVCAIRCIQRNSTQDQKDWTVERIKRAMARAATKAETKVCPDCGWDGKGYTEFGSTRAVATCKGHSPAPAPQKEK